MVQYVADDVLQELFGQLTVAIEITEGHLGFDHPEFGEVARGVRILGAEGGAEGVNIREGQCENLGFELAAYGQVGGAGEEVFELVGLAGRERRYTEHGAGAFGVRSGDQRGVDVKESAVLEEFVDGEGECVAHAE